MNIQFGFAWIAVGRHLDEPLLLTVVTWSLADAVQEPITFRILFDLCAGDVRTLDVGEVVGDDKWDAGFGCSVT